MNIEKSENRIIIVGGGFAGIRCALDLSNKNLSNTKIILISNKTHFEYYPRIYRVVTGDSPLEVCIPLDSIFQNKNVEVLLDEITEVSLKENTLKGSSGTKYSYDQLVLALGSETVYFGIEGVQEQSFGFKSIQEAIKLKKHLHKLFDVYLSKTKEDIVASLHVVVVGGGPSGIELVGELTKYMKYLAQLHRVDNNFITIDLIEASTRLAPTLPEDVSRRLYDRLHSLGVNIFLNRAVVKQDIDEITMKGMSLQSNTLIWTAGSRTNKFYESIADLNLFRNGRVIVNEYLNADNWDNVYIAGDAANTTYAGLAQTALYDGSYVSKVIASKIRNKKIAKYVPKKVAYAVPVGKYWAAVAVGPLKIYGFIAFCIREFIDLRFFLSILPIRKAFRVYRNNAICESCEICSKNKA